MVMLSLETLAIIAVAVLSGVIGYLFKQVQDLWRAVNKLMVVVLGHEQAEEGGLKGNHSELEEEYEGMKTQIDDIQDTVDEIKDTVNGDYNDSGD